MVHTVLVQYYNSPGEDWTTTQYSTSEDCTTPGASLGVRPKVQVDDQNNAH